MNTTMKKNLIIPEVMGEVADSHFGRRITLLPVTQIDDTLEGVPGDTLKFPCFRYIGKADEVAENGQVAAGLLSADTVEAKVKKYAKAVCITDEARMSGAGDPVGEAAKQLAYAIDHALDEELFSVLKGLGGARQMAAESLSSDAVADALTLFGEDMQGEKLLVTDAEGFAELRKDPAYIRASDMGQKMICDGVAGEIWGCQIVISSRVREDSETGEKRRYILKPGALRLVSKRGTAVEKHREPEYMRDTVYASRHCACYLYDQARAAALVTYTALKVIENAGIEAEEGDKAGETRLILPAALAAPLSMRWMYTMENDPAPKGVFGKDVTGAKEWRGGSLPTGGKQWVHLYLTGKKDMKPVKEAAVPAVVK